MDRVGVRELKQNASRVLERVKAGETVQVTQHGRPVALLTPLTGADEFDRLVEAGEVLLGTQELAAAAPVAVAVAPGVRLSDEVASLRRDDWR
jgi:prevent-host-death family protein